MALSKISRVEHAIQVLDEAEKNIKKERAALMALLPRQRRSLAKGKILNPATGKLEPYRNNKR